MVDDKKVNMTRTPKQAAPLPAVQAEVIQVLVADSGAIQSQLLARALKTRRDFQVSAVDLEMTALQNFLQSNHADVILIAASRLPDLSLLHWLRLSYPRMSSVLLVDTDERELVVNACAPAPRVFFFSPKPLFPCSASAFSAFFAARFGSTASR